MASALFFAMTTAGYSQTQAKPEKTPQERADNQTKRLTKSLSLTPDQATKVNAVLLDRDNKIKAIEDKYANSTDKKAMHGEKKAVHDQTDASLKGIFTPEQYTSYTTMKEENKAKKKATK